MTSNALESRRHSSTTARLHFALRRLHSLSGIVPLGVFLVEHLLTNARVLWDPGSFAQGVRAIQAIPFLGALEVVGIFLPLTFHAVYGLAIALQGGANVVQYPYTRNWMYLLQRVTGVVALAFIVVHLGQYRFQTLVHKMVWTDFYERLAIDLNRPAIYVLYATGVTATVFHFANGVWQFANSWGIVVRATQQRRLAIACAALGLVTWAIGIDILLHFAFRCGGVVPLPGFDPSACGR